MVISSGTDIRNPQDQRYEPGYKGQRQTSASKVKVLIVWRVTDLRTDMVTCYENSGLRKISQHNINMNNI